ncbi:MAG: cytochrome P450 [Lasallia pustulata]|uniref:Cytochrome P450 n=1 Tax=Lasallia pustulata TaxID=136370 RepID=A0A5M8PKZ1_9LECA|nr:MAG: cytochrome P450 [Lasallia pustulata]
MDFTSNMTSTKLLSRVDLNSHDFQSPVTLGLAGFIATFISFLAYLSYSPRVDNKFFTHKSVFWKNSMEKSETGNFSFWLGKNHVVGVPGEAARKMYMDNRNGGATWILSKELPSLDTDQTL